MAAAQSRPGQGQRQGHRQGQRQRQRVARSTLPLPLPLLVPVPRLGLGLGLRLRLRLRLGLKQGQGCTRGWRDDPDIAVSKDGPDALQRFPLPPPRRRSHSAALPSQIQLNASSAQAQAHRRVPKGVREGAGLWRGGDDGGEWSTTACSLAGREAKLSEGAGPCLAHAAQEVNLSGVEQSPHEGHELQAAHHAALSHCPCCCPCPWGWWEGAEGEGGEGKESPRDENHFPHSSQGAHWPRQRLYLCPCPCPCCWCWCW